MISNNVFGSSLNNWDKVKYSVGMFTHKSHSLAMSLTHSTASHDNNNSVGNLSWKNTASKVLNSSQVSAAYSASFALFARRAKEEGF